MCARRTADASTHGEVVTLEKLSSQLRRDLAANPKKAAVLGLMVLVALYCWGPLVWKWATASTSKSPSAAATASLILTDDPADATHHAKPRGIAKFRWEKVRQQIHEDQHMQSAVFDVSWADPFGKSALVRAAETPNEPKPEQETAPAEVTQQQLADLNIVLNGVFIGARSRVATINGEPCYEGETVNLGGDNENSTSLAVRVARIQRQSVLLELNGRFISLEINSPKLARGDEIERTKTLNQ